MRAGIDDVDWEIFQLLKQDGRIRNTEIAKRLKLSEAATRKRLKRLMDNEYVRVGAYLNYMKLGHTVEGNLKIKAVGNKHEQVARTLAEMDSVIYLVHTAGAMDFDVDFSVKSQSDLHELLAIVNNIDGVTSVEFAIRLKLLKLRYDVLKSD